MKWEEVITFWFEESTPGQWFKKSDEFDAKVRERFENVYRQVVAGETEDWRSKPEGRLAEVIVLDQFSRNMFRDDPQAFAHDSLALVLAQEAIRVGDDQKLDTIKRRFLYMPFMHSESKKVHETAVKLFKTLGHKETIDYEIKHKDIIDRFGRYPHRNEVLGRTSTPEEIAFVKEHGGF